MEKEDEYSLINEKSQASTRKIAAFLFGIGFSIAYWVWPDGITNLTLSQIRFGALLQAGASSAIALVALVIAFFLWID